MTRQTKEPIRMQCKHREAFDKCIKESMYYVLCKYTGRTEHLLIGHRIGASVSLLSQS